MWFECRCGLEYFAWNQQQGPAYERELRCGLCRWTVARWIMDKIGTGSTNGWSYRLRGYWPPERRRRKRYMEESIRLYRERQEAKRCTDRSID